DAQARDPATARRLLERVLQFPQVESSSRISLIAASLDVPGRKRAGDVFPLVSLDGRFGTTINGAKILEGRMYDPAAPDEIVASSGVAEDLGMHVGQSIRMTCCGIFGRPYPSFNPPPPLTMHVVGIAAVPGMFQPLAGGYLPGVLLSPAFYRDHPQWINRRNPAAALVLRRGLADVPAFAEAVRGIRDQLP